MPKRKDEYAVAVDRLTDHPEEIVEAWSYPAPGDTRQTVNNHVLFRACSPSGEPDINRAGYRVGCLTQVKCEEDHAWTKALTRSIVKDPLVPLSPEHFSRDKKERRQQLQRFAYYQRIFRKLRPIKKATA